MDYEVTLIGGAGERTRIEAPIGDFALEHEDDGTRELRLAWRKETLKDDPHGYIAVSAAWPGVGGLELRHVFDENEEPVFSGGVTGIGYDHDSLSITARAAAVVPPEPLVLTVEADTEDPDRLTAKIMVDNKGEGEVSVDFGDGSPTETNPGDGTTATSHVYGAGEYTVTVTDIDQSERTASEALSIPFPGASELVLTITEDDSDPMGMRAGIVVDNAAHGSVDIVFGDGTPAQTNPGDGTTVTTHTWISPGNYLVTATDVDEPERTANQEVAVPFGANALTVSVEVDENDTTRMTGRIVADNKGHGNVTVSFGDGTPPQTNAGDGVAVTSHTWAEPGTFSVVAVDQEQLTRMATVPVIVPFP